MEIPVINRLSEFELSTQNPSLLSRVLSVSGFETSSFWKLGALILAIVASFGTLVNGIKVFIFKIKRLNSIASEPLLKFVVDDYTDSDDETCSSSSSYLDDEEEDSDDDDDNEPKLHRYQPMDDDFRVAGGSGRHVESYEETPTPKLRRGFSWADLTGGRSVVKLWDKLGLGLDFDDDGTAGDESYSSVFSLYQTNREQRIVSLWRAAPAVDSKSPPVIVAARTSGSGDVSLGVWDTRLRRRIPAILAEWQPQLGKIVGIGYGGVEKVYVRDDATGDLTVGDMRNVSSPLTNVTASDLDSWWDADDAVFVQDEQPGCESD